MPPCLALSPAFHLDTLCSRCLPERIYEKTNGFWRKHTASMLMLSTHKARVWSLKSRNSQTVASAIPGIELGVVHSILLFFAKLQYRFSPQLLTCSWEFLCRSMSIARVLSRWRSWRLLVLSLVFLSLSLHPPDGEQIKGKIVRSEERNFTPLCRNWDSKMDGLNQLYKASAIERQCCRRWCHGRPMWSHTPMWVVPQGSPHTLWEEQDCELPDLLSLTWSQSYLVFSVLLWLLLPSSFFSPGRFHPADLSGCL